jgi:large subunit ribosomal protein L25
MSEFGVLGVTVRQPGGKGAVRKLRASGKFPAVIYGQGKDNVAIAIDPLEFGRASDPAKGFNTFFRLSVTQDGKDVGVETCLIVDFQRDSLRADVLHVDFVRVDPEVEVVRPVPVRIIGRAAGVVKGGRIKSPYRTVSVAAKPADVPNEVVIDVTPLDTGDAIRMRDIQLTNARVVESPDAAIVSCEMAYAKAEEAADPKAPAAAGAKPAAGAPAKAAAKPAAKAPAKK